jgi:hypothetical protein
MIPIIHKIIARLTIQIASKELGLVSAKIGGKSLLPIIRSRVCQFGRKNISNVPISLKKRV